MFWEEYELKDGGAECLAGCMEDVIVFTKTHNGRHIYSWRKQTIERSFAEAKVNHGLCYDRMLGIRNIENNRTYGKGTLIVGVGEASIIDMLLLSKVVQRLIISHIKASL